MREDRGKVMWIIALMVVTAFVQTAGVASVMPFLAVVTEPDIVNSNTALHFACRGAKYKTIALLLGKYDAVSVSRRNAEGMLPIDVLCESDEVVDRESVEYTESLFRLLRAYPETVMNCM